MAEKGDVSADTVSLPPTYAPSEAFTDSPPPAYRRAKSTTVQVARMICITLLAVAFMIGFFTLTSNYLSAKQCDCHGSDHKHGGQHHVASVFPVVEKLVGEEGLNRVDEMNGNGLDAPEDPSFGKDFVQQEMEAEDEAPMPDAEEEELNGNIPEEEVEALVEEVAELEEVERELEEELGSPDTLQEQIEEMKKKIKLPIDLILGNPAMAGRDVNCEVERRQQPIGGGIVTQAIIVTCSDNDDKDMTDGPATVVSSLGPRRLGPPMSLLAPIMKMLSTRARARVEKPIQIKTMSAPPPFPLSSGPKPCSPNGPFPCFINKAKSLGPFPGPFNSPNSGPFPGRVSMPLNGPNSGPFPGPVSMPFNGPNSSPFPGPVSMPFNGPMSSPFSGPFPGSNGPFPSPSGPFPSPNGPFPSPSGPFPSPSGPFPSPSGPFPSPSGPFPSPNGPFPSSSGPSPTPNGPLPVGNGPFPGPMPGPNPGQNSNHIHIPVNGPKLTVLPEPTERPEPSLPKSILQDRVTIEEMDNEPRNRMLPFALRPLVRMSPRMPRILALAARPDRQGLQIPISSLQRGANNINLREPKIIPGNPVPLPQAQGRALPSPVTLPGIRLLPARLLSAPAFVRGLRRDDSRPITHMEMRKPEPEAKVPDFEPRFPDFGPPRVHTVIGPNQPRIPNHLPPVTHPMIKEMSPVKIVSKIIEVNSAPISKDIMTPPKPIAVIHKAQPIAGSQIPIFPPPPPPPPSSINIPPPPPKMDPSGRSGIIHNINPDAEMIHSDHPPHVSHSFSGPPPPPPPPQHMITKEEVHEQPQGEQDRKHHLLIVN